MKDVVPDTSRPDCISDKVHEKIRDLAQTLAEEIVQQVDQQVMNQVTIQAIELQELREQNQELERRLRLKPAA